jgi:hypothetical protein
MAAGRECRVRCAVEDQLRAVGGSAGRRVAPFVAVLRTRNCSAWRAGGGFAAQGGADERGERGERGP